MLTRTVSVTNVLYAISLLEKDELITNDRFVLEFTVNTIHMYMD